MNNKTENFITVLNIIVTIFIVYFCTLMLYNSVLDGDVIFEGLPVSMDKFIYPVHGRYIAEVFSRTIGIFNNFGFHPMNFVCTGSAFMKTCFTVLMCYLATGFFFIFSRKNILMPFVLLASFSYFFIYRVFEIYNITQFFGYTSMMIFYMAFWLIFIKHFVNQELPNKKDILLNSLLAFALGTATEFMNISTIFTLFYLFIYSLFIFGKETSWNLSQIWLRFKNLGSALYIPLFSFFIGMLLSYGNPSFWIQAKKDKNIEITDSLFMNIINTSGEFIHSYVKLIIINHSIQLITIAVLFLIISIMVKFKKVNSRFLIISLALFLGIMSFYFSLCLFGKTYYEEGLFWLSHIGLQKILDFALYIIIVLNIGYICSLFKNKILSFILNTFLIIYICNFSLGLANTYKDIQEYSAFLRKIRISTYKVDKICNFYFLQNKTAIIPKEYVSYLRGNVDLIDYKANIYDPSINIKVIKDSGYLNYFSNAYKNINSYGYKFTSEKEALRLYRQAGGWFTEEELNRLDFNRLKDKNYIMNKPEIKDQILYY